MATGGTAGWFGRRNLRDTAAAILAALALSACGSGGGSGADGTDGPAGPAGPPGPAGPGAGATNVIGEYDPMPGVKLVITGLTGGTGPGGSFNAGNVITVNFTAKANDGTNLDVLTLNSGSIYVSGPSFNYQRVIASQSDLRARSVSLGGGAWSYTFLAAIPATYLGPLNDTAAFGTADGEMTGQALLPGTYTVGMQADRMCSVGEEEYRDAGNATYDFLLGGATSIDHREVVTNANCNACHTDLRIHSQRRKDVRLCVLCHTSGAEDNNNPALAGGTPGVTVDFKVMIHKLHNAAHLASVNGVATNADGTRNYVATPKPLEYAGGSSVHDFSEIGFPVWPSLNIAMPRDQGYTALSTADKATEDKMRTGAVACAKCHGDPDGAGPLPAPAQGLRYETAPARLACGSCHDDIDWTKPYVSNGQTMPANQSDSGCALCHADTGGNLAVRDAHRHPVVDPSFNPGTNFNVATFAEAGTNDGDGTIDVGEKIQLSMTITNDAGAGITPSTLGSSFSVVISGPVTNRNMLLSGSIPTTHPAFSAGVGSPPVYTLNVPQAVVLESAGVNVLGVPAEVFTTARTPHLNIAAAPTTVYTRTEVLGGATTTSADSALWQNFVDVNSVASFAKDDYVVIADGSGSKEFARVAWVDGSRLWLTVPLRFAHGSGTGVLEIALATRTLTTDYTLNAATGQVTENGSAFDPATDVVVSYTSDFVMPSTFPAPINDSPDITETWGEWTGKPIVEGTYTLGVWGRVTKSLALFGETNSYSLTSAPETVNFRVANAESLDTYEMVAGNGQTCNACHDDLYFHGAGRRGFDTCILCHGTAGFEDRARYTAANAPATTAVAGSFREMLHRVHMGKELQDPTYSFVGYGSTAYPNNFGVGTFEEIGFPAMPDGVKECAKCHGNDAWEVPTDRAHPTAQGVPVRNFGVVCGSCHNGATALAHIAANTAGNGAEACAVCHGSMRIADVAKVHIVR